MQILPELPETVTEECACPPHPPSELCTCLLPPPEWDSECEKEASFTSRLLEADESPWEEEWWCDECLELCTLVTLVVDVDTKVEEVKVEEAWYSAA